MFSFALVGSGRCGLDSNSFDDSDSDYSDDDSGNVDDDGVNAFVLSTTAPERQFADVPSGVRMKKEPSVSGWRLAAAQVPVLTRVVRSCGVRKYVRT